MRVISCLSRWILAATVGLALPMFGCGDDTHPEPSWPGMQDSGTSATQLDASAVISSAQADGGGTQRDAGGATAPGSGSAGFDGGGKPIGAEDATTGKPDAGTDAVQDGGAGGSGDGGAKSDATTPAPGMDPCLMMFEEPAYGQPGEDDDSSLLQVNGGVTVRGVGCKAMWEGIVMTIGGRGLCTAAFISERHLISASHCYARDGAVSLQVKAPTWDNGMTHTFQATVQRSGSNMSLDVAVIDLGKAVEWATPERRFVLHAGKATSVDMHLYGFGDGGSSGAAGTLRGVPNHATIRVTDNGRGNLNGKAGPAQLCTGDSGGPAFVEKTRPVLYGINQAIVPASTAGGRTCAGPDWTIMFTNVSAYMMFIDGAVGKPCERKQVDGLDVAQCWSP